MNFELLKNPDGTFSIYNNEIGDIYYSNIGAHTEAMQKFVIPSDITRVNKKKLKILDVCYGMGYNSKSFVDFCLKKNLNFDFDIDCIELDKNILLLGLLAFDKNIDKNVHLVFGGQILRQIDFEKNVEEFLGENSIKEFLQDICGDFSFFDTLKDIPEYQNSKNTTFLHNIYYQNHEVFKKNDWNLKINMILNNLLDTLPTINTGYDFIFHDAFSIRKQPELWTEEVFSEYYRLLVPNGKLLTYSNSRVVRRILENIGFGVRINFNEQEKQNGTIAIKT